MTRRHPPQLAVSRRTALALVLLYLLTISLAVAGILLAAGLRPTF